MLVCPGCGEENPAQFRLCGYCGTALARTPPVREVRKTVTIVFSDLKGSTSLGERLDSEALREVMTRYFDEIRAVLERHGGTVEKFIGDAVMAVFGLPRAARGRRAAGGARRLGDAGRARRAERRARASATGVRLANRTGVNTGEVVAGDADVGQRLVTGDAVNVAARLEQAAAENEILIGESTYRLVKDAVTVEAVDPLPLKGKSELVPAYRLLGVRPTHRGLTRRVDTPMVGREAELQRPARPLRPRRRRQRRASSSPSSGPPGSASRGSPRSCSTSVDGRATVLRCHCLPYGEGITFWPLRAASPRRAAHRRGEPQQTAQRQARRARRAPTTPTSPTAGRGDRPVRQRYRCRRRSGRPGGSSRSWPRDGPVVMLIDDIHWAEPTFLDLIEHVVRHREAPILLAVPDPPRAPRRAAEPGPPSGRTPSGSSSTRSPRPRANRWSPTCSARRASRAGPERIAQTAGATRSTSSRSCRC